MGRTRAHDCPDEHRKQAGQSEYGALYTSAGLNVNAGIPHRPERFITGREICNGFSELNDPEDQAARLHTQSQRRRLRQSPRIRPAPTAGEGTGIDRLVVLCTDSPAIRDVILFPQLRKE